VISLDCGANTHFAARCLKLRANQRLTGTGMLASMTWMTPSPARQQDNTLFTASSIRRVTVVFRIFCPRVGWAF
jgi:DNA-binding transcriptional regulator PaaX